jgi:hypothetical protein
MENITYLSQSDFKFPQNEKQNGTYGILINQPGIYRLNADIYLNKHKYQCMIGILILGDNIVFDGNGYKIYLKAQNQVGVAFMGHEILIRNIGVEKYTNSEAFILLDEDGNSKNIINTEYDTHSYVTFNYRRIHLLLNEINLNYYNNLLKILKGSPKFGEIGIALIIANYCKAQILRI